MKKVLIFLSIILLFAVKAQPETSLTSQLVEDIIQLKKAQVGEEIIKEKIKEERRHVVILPPNPGEIARLKEAKVSDGIIKMLLGEEEFGPEERKSKEKKENPVLEESILKLKKAGLGEDIIQSYIQERLRLAKEKVAYKPITQDEIIRLKLAGVGDRTIQLMLRDQKESRLPQWMYETAFAYENMGTWTVKDAEGKESIIYSTGRVEEMDQEDEDRIRAWEMLRNMRIYLLK